VAGGMMLAASYSLAAEGASFTEAPGLPVSPAVAVAAGAAAGVVFILLTKRVLDQFEHLKTEVDGASAQKMVLIVFVMTLHSLTEGIGIGVSFGGQSGMQLGQFISFSLAVHNVPEGLAVALVMTSRKVTQLRAALWAVFTSLPQPLMAVPGTRPAAHSPHHPRPRVCSCPSPCPTPLCPLS
jgi:zinc transporter ZupT